MSMLDRYLWKRDLLQLFKLVIATACGALAVGAVFALGTTGFLDWSSPAFLNSQAIDSTSLMWTTWIVGSLGLAALLVAPAILLLRDAAVFRSTAMMAGMAMLWVLVWVPISGRVALVGSVLLVALLMVVCRRRFAPRATTTDMSRALR